MKKQACLNMLKEVCIIFLLNYGVRIQADIFTAVTEFDNLIKAHKTIKDYLDLYIKRHEERLAVLKNFLDICKREHENAMKDIPKYLDNPINIFTLTKRLTVDINFIQYSIQDETDYIEDITSKLYGDKYPTMEYLLGAAEALIRLQNIYNLGAKEIAEGTLNSVADSSPMTVSDRYELGRVLNNNNYFINGLEWMLEAFRKYNAEGTYYPFSDIDIMEHISYGYFKTGDMNSALYWIQKIFEKDPQNSRAMKMEKQCLTYMRDSRYGLWKSKMEEDKELQRQLKDSNEVLYNPLCRGDMELPVEISSRLTCRYQTEIHPFAKLAPFKTEMLYLNPDIVMFHDVLSNSEIETVLEIARFRLFRSGVQVFEKESSSSPQRISKSANIDDRESDVVARISRRVTHMTGFSLKNAELLQIANYGIGGYYHFHHDFFKHEPSKILGNRIATVLFYMSNVTQGGATIFAALGVTVFPVKGAAIYWLNLHASGEKNYCMLHAACPILIGSKWVATRWIQEVGQEFIKPCNLEYQKKGCPHNYPSPIFKMTRKKKHVLFKKP